LIQNVEKFVDQVKQAISEQTEGGKQILQAVSRLNSITAEVRNKSSKAEQKNNEVKGKLQDLEAITNDLAGFIEGITGNAAEIDQAMLEVDRLSQENKDAIAEIIEETQQFKVDE
jgi:methyl-accepting chemotaxis protein